MGQIAEQWAIVVFRLRASNSGKCGCSMVRPGQELSSSMIELLRVTETYDGSEDFSKFVDKLHQKAQDESLRNGLGKIPDLR